MKTEILVEEKEILTDIRTKCCCIFSGLMDTLAVLFKKFTGARGRRIEGIKFLIAVAGGLEYLVKL